MLDEGNADRRPEPRGSASAFRTAASDLEAAGASEHYHASIWFSKIVVLSNEADKP